MSRQDVYLGVYDGLSDWEFGFATGHINQALWQHTPDRYRVVTVGATDQSIVTTGGLRVLPDISVEDVSISDAAMLILPGSTAWNPANEGPTGKFAELATKFLAERKPVAAICGATLGLAAAGVLNDRTHTSNAREYLALAPGYQSDKYREEPAVSDGGLITAKGPAPVEFARRILAELDLYTPDVLEAWTNFYTTGEPKWFFELESRAQREATA